MKFRVPKLGGWKRLISKNAYAAVSLMILALYLGAFMFGVSFLVAHIRAAFDIDETLVEQSVTSLDMESYKKIAERFGLQ